MLRGENDPPAGGPPFGFGFLSNNTTVGAPSLRFLQGWAATLPMRFVSNPRGVKARAPLCDHPATPPSEKGREGWGSHCAVCHRKAGHPHRGVGAGARLTGPPWGSTFLVHGEIQPILTH